jgi:hypothetical protein
MSWIRCFPLRPSSRCCNRLETSSGYTLEVCFTEKMNTAAKTSNRPTSLTTPSASSRATSTTMITRIISTASLTAVKPGPDNPSKKANGSPPPSPSPAATPGSAAPTRSCTAPPTLAQDGPKSADRKTAPLGGAAYLIISITLHHPQHAFSRVRRRLRTPRRTRKKLAH